MNYYNIHLHNHYILTYSNLNVNYDLANYYQQYNIGIYNLYDECFVEPCYFNKRLDYVNAELERLRNKNHKLKGKYKQLKQAVFISDDEDAEEPEEQEQLEQPVHEVGSIRDNKSQQTIVQPSEPILRPQPKRSTGINFNRFFN